MFNPKIAFLLLAIVPLKVVSAPAQPSKTAPVADEIQVEVRAAKDKYLGGEPVILTITLRNNTDKPVSFLMRPAGFEFALKNDRTGKGRQLKVIATRRGKDENASGKVGERTVVAHDAFSYQVVLSRAFDMSRAGTYMVSSHKNLRLDGRAPGGDLIGATKVARDVKIVVLDADVSS